MIAPLFHTTWRLVWRAGTAGLYSSHCCQQGSWGSVLGWSYWTPRHPALWTCSSSSWAFSQDCLSQWLENGKRMHVQFVWWIGLHPNWRLLTQSTPSSPIPQGFANGILFLFAHTLTFFILPQFFLILLQWFIYGFFWSFGFRFHIRSMSETKLQCCRPIKQRIRVQKSLSKFSTSPCVANNENNIVRPLQPGQIFCCGWLLRNPLKSHVPPLQLTLFLTTHFWWWQSTSCYSSYQRSTVFEKTRTKHRKEQTSAFLLGKWWSVFLQPQLFNQAFDL